MTICGYRETKQPHLKKNKYFKAEFHHIFPILMRRSFNLNFAGWEFENSDPKIVRENKVLKSHLSVSKRRTNGLET